MNVRELIAILQTTNQEATIKDSYMREILGVYYNSDLAEICLNQATVEQPAIGWQLLQAPEQWKPDTTTKDAALAAIEGYWNLCKETDILDTDPMDKIIHDMQCFPEVQHYINELPAIRDIRKKVIRDKISKLFMDYIDSKE